MTKNKIVKRTVVAETLSEDDKERLNDIERMAKEDFPPDVRQPARTGVAAQIRRARKAQGLSWSAVAEMAGMTDAEVVREIEYGMDAKLSSVEAVAKVLGLKLEAVEV